MHLRKFLYCWPLKYGVITVGIAFGLTDFIVGSIAWDMVIRNKYPDYVVEFFRTMDTRICVSGFATVFWLMMTNHFLLIYAVFYVSSNASERNLANPISKILLNSAQTFDNRNLAVDKLHGIFVHPCHRVVG